MSEREALIQPQSLGASAGINFKGTHLWPLTVATNPPVWIKVK